MKEVRERLDELLLKRYRGAGWTSEDEGEFIAKVAALLAALDTEEELEEWRQEALGRA